MNEYPDVRVGQRYVDVKEKTGRTLEVQAIKLQPKTEGRFKARYTYAQVEVYGGKDPYSGRPTAVKRVWIDTDRLKSPAYKLVYNPCPVPAEGTPDACPTPAAASGGAS